MCQARTLPRHHLCGSQVDLFVVCAVVANRKFLHAPVSLRRARSVRSGVPFRCCRSLSSTGQSRTSKSWRRCAPSSCEQCYENGGGKKQKTSWSCLATPPTPPTVLANVEMHLNTFIMFFLSVHGKRGETKTKRSLTKIPNRANRRAQTIHPLSCPFSSNI